MATNLAVKRAKRAQARKQVVAQKRRLELVDSGLGAQARRAALAPIRLCLLHGDLIEDGSASVVLARGHGETLTTAVFLVDVYCLGIKDVFMRALDSDDLTMMCEEMAAAAPIAPVDPAYARKLLRDAAAWAASIGFKPPRDHAAIEQLFGDIDTDACDTAFTFGRDGKPLYIPGPSETRAQVRQRVTHLISRFGEEGFEYVAGEVD